MAAAANPDAAAGLRRDAIGLREVLFQSITDMAPGAAIAASIPAGAAMAGGSLPLSVIVALVACLFCAWCIGLLAARDALRRVHGDLRRPRPAPVPGLPGGLGDTCWVGLLIPPLVLLQLGFTTASTLNPSSTATRPACGGRGPCSAH